MPIGQLDGGHITYALLGNKHKIVARFFFGLLILMSAIGGLNELGWTNWYDYGSLMWVVWVVLLIFLIKIDHPPFYDPGTLGTGRKLLGVFAFVMFICSFTPSPINVF
jgi:membrane-associated protease RseP (regulator of RpoE activity)